MDAATLAGALALIGAVIVISALMSGFIERASIPQVAVFLLLGAAIGPHGLALMDVGLDSPFLRVVSTVALALVLFTDAVTLDLSEVRRHGLLAFSILGPGTLLATAGIALAANRLIGLEWPASIVLASALASTDPVMLRGLLRRRDLSPQTRLGLRLESGLNDIVLLPTLLLAMLFMPGAVGESAPMGTMLVELFVLGPGAGALVGLAAIGALRLARGRIGVRRDYESIYSLGVCFAAFAAAEAVHGSGFLACFAAGVVIAAADKELCDCFVEYGETTAEMLLMFTFVLLGGSLIWGGLATLSLGLAAFAVLALLARTIGMLAALSGIRMDRGARMILVWFGPRGLSTLLLVLLPVFAARTGSERLFEISSIVVLLSVLVHGGSIMALGRRRPTAPSDRLRITDPLLTSVAEVRRLEETNEPITLGDVRTARSLEANGQTLEGSLRLDPESVVDAATGQQIAKQAWIALFCT